MSVAANIYTPVLLSGDASRTREATRSQARGRHFKGETPSVKAGAHAAPAGLAGAAPEPRPRRESQQASAKQNATNKMRALPAKVASAAAVPVTAAPATATPAANRPRPTSAQVRTELTRERRIRRTIAVAKSTIYALVVVAAAAVLAATLFTPVFRIYGTSMNPTFTEGDFVVAVTTSDLTPGDPVVFYYENKVLVKRYIARAGQWVDIDSNGNVYVDGELLDEPYVQELALGECDIELPYQVPEGRIFVLGDNRATSVDSRSTSVGCVSEEQLVGKIVFRVWPLSAFGTV